MPQINKTKAKNEPKYAPASLKNIDFTVKHAEEFYEEYINNFSRNEDKRLLYRIIKRLGDVILSALGLIVLAPLFMAIIIAIRLDSKGSAIFKQQRVGMDGKLFKLIKFRTMTVDTPPNLPTSQFEDPENYCTRVGKFLRKTSLDELPQLWCVLTGKMSLVGYRPLVPNEIKANEMRARLGVFSMRPGITGLAQINGRDEVYYRNRALLDAEYVKSASALLDIKILIATVPVVLKGEGNRDCVKEENNVGV